MVTGSDTAAGLKGASREALLGFVGDVLVKRDEPREVFGRVEEILAIPDVLFANLEGVYTDHPRPMPTSPLALASPANNLSVFGDVGFNVMSLANNHILDAGYEAMLETRSRLREQGVATCGAGESLADAREPAILNVNGLRIAFLAYASVFPLGCEARATTPGVVPVRACNYWRDPWPTLHTPGARPIVTTIPNQADLACLAEDIGLARQRADLVITSFHWGDHTCSFHLTDHEIRTARYCVDEGAHMVVGHHHHALRGMEWYQGKPIMYGLGHFVFDFHLPWTEADVRALAESELGRYFRRIGFEAGPREGWPLLPMPGDARFTALAWARADAGGVREIGFLPCMLTPKGVVEPHDPDSPEGREVLEYMEYCNSSQGLRSAIVSESAVTLAGFRTVRVVSAA